MIKLFFLIGYALAPFILVGAFIAAVVMISQRRKYPTRLYMGLAAAALLAAILGSLPYIAEWVRGAPASPPPIASQR